MTGIKGGGREEGGSWGWVKGRKEEETEECCKGEREEIVLKTSIEKPKTGS